MIPALVVCQSSDVKVVAFGDLGNLRDQIAVRPLRKVFVHRELGLLAWNHVVLVARRDYDFLRHMPDHFIHHEHHGNAKLFGQIESADGEIKTVLGVNSGTRR